MTVKSPEEIKARKKEYKKTYYSTHRDEILAKGRAYDASHREKRKAYRASHRDEINAYARDYRIKHRDEVNIKRRTYNAAHKEKIYAQNKAYRAVHREELNARKRAYYATDREKYNARHRAWRAANRKKVRFYGLKDRLGMSQAEYEALLDSQGGVCAICQKSNWNGKTPHVDHDHTTGKIRGILCHNCNYSLGLIMDDPKIAQAMVDYLEKYK